MDKVEQEVNLESAKYDLENKITESKSDSRAQAIASTISAGMVAIGFYLISHQDPSSVPDSSPLLLIGFGTVGTIGCAVDYFREKIKCRKYKKGLKIIRDNLVKLTGNVLYNYI